MKHYFTNKISKVIVTLFIGAIIVSFALTSVTTNVYNSADVVASVGNTSITQKELERAFQQRLATIEAQSNKSITQKRVKDMIKNSVLNNLIQQKLLLNYSEQLNLQASEERVAQEIKDLPFFQTNEQFDINKYKKLLQANGLTPQEFETQIQESVKINILNDLINSLPVSEPYLKTVKSYKNQKALVSMIKIEPRKLEKFIDVSNSEVNNFLSNHANEKQLQQLYQQNFSKYNKPEEIKVSHILLRTDSQAPDQVKKESQEIREKLNAKNFSQLAKKYSMDPMSKENGGQLDWLSKGKRSKEFDQAAFKLKKGEISKPIKTVFGYHIIYVEDKKAAKTQSLKSVEKKLAKELLQKQKTEKKEELANAIAQNVAKAMKNNNQKELKSLAKKYNLTLLEEKWLNRYDRFIGKTQLEPIQTKDIFTQKKKVFAFSSPLESLIINVHKQKAPSELNKLDEIRNSQKLFLSQKFQTELLQSLQRNTDIKTKQEIL